jgi:hypothetical protein
VDWGDQGRFSRVNRNSYGRFGISILFLISATLRVPPYHTGSARL